MIESSNFYVPLATRAGFNRSVRHIKQAIALDELCVEDRINIADAVNELLADKSLDQSSPASLLSVLLLGKWNYSVKSRNLVKASSDGLAIFEEVKKWKAVDVVIAYHHPDLGLMLINPKNPGYAETLGEFRKNELVVVYAGSPRNKTDKKLADTAVEKLVDLLEGKKVKVPDALLKGSCSFVVPPAQQEAEENAKKAAKAAKAAKASAKKSGKKVAASGAGMPDFVGAAAATASTLNLETKKVAPASSADPMAAATAAALVPTPVVAVARKLTPLYSVPVTNELFHNGNVEAWKRIINSFRAKYPYLDVYVYYDGERIIDINTLFKWGKVKHGSVIQFAVAGEGPKDVAKLQRYFNQGASPQFEAFLHGSPNTVMNLF